ncbi:MAG: hypothetical protein JO097_18995 [Acidobacteriaceae bacterium]|nr:hypothetical protein [Acidobacteriaceae bacterium]MBV9294228.1 hypothetical protein [Acidobacteriaceae bacterium]MBV9767370.1 hypothetical protein [Acidobacteriaceae bacterium]
MASVPQRPGELDEDTKKILDERLRTLEQDEKQAVPAEQVIREGRAKLLKLQKPAP